jgi:tetratricopeptide (TPR) repeat protein
VAKGSEGAGGPDTAKSADAAGKGDAADKNAGAKALYDKAHDAMDESNFQQALTYADASLKLRKTARTYLLRAQAQQRLDQIDAALASVDAAEGISPTMGAVWEMRGRILWAARRRDEARAAFDKFLSLEPDSPKAAAVRRLISEPR